VPPPGEGRRVLVAGQGCGLLPFLVAARLPGAQVAATDDDARAAKVFPRLRHPARARVEFHPAPLRELPFEAGAFDAACCLATLQHTSQHTKALDELRRVLRPGGALIVSFDLSLDCHSDLAPEAARRLLQLVEARFEPLRSLPPERFDVDLFTPDILTTDHVRRVAPDLLPWRVTPARALRALLRLHKPSRPHFRSTVFCGSYRVRA
jgi:SAM-dependent methyltransferase